MKRLLEILIVALISAFGGLVAENELPEPYCSIVDLPVDQHGWFGNADQLSNCFKERQISKVIEIGAWLGASTRFLATSTPANGKVYAVDTWNGSPQETLHMQDPRLPYLYQLFLSNVKQAQLTHKIVPIRMNSLEAAKALNVKADLIYIDAAHDTESVYQDIIAWYPHLEEGGIMCGDDWLWDSVRVAVIKASEQLNRSIEATGNFWRFY
jgi:predicted O-methyltransferase YrrM